MLWAPCSSSLTNPTADVKLAAGDELGDQRQLCLGTVSPKLGLGRDSSCIGVPQYAPVYKQSYGEPPFFPARGKTQFKLSDNNFFKLRQCNITALVGRNLKDRRMFEWVWWEGSLKITRP